MPKAYCKNCGNSFYVDKDTYIKLLNIECDLINKFAEILNQPKKGPNSLDFFDASIKCCVAPDYTYMTKRKGLYE